MKFPCKTGQVVASIVLHKASPGGGGRHPWLLRSASRTASWGRYDVPTFPNKSTSLRFVRVLFNNSPADSTGNALKHVRAHFAEEHLGADFSTCCLPLYLRIFVTDCDCMKKYIRNSRDSRVSSMWPRP
ncbi:hypothetical protein J6590_104986 [Homalodisca vitripennis]|nr:hypothetical protein J6590_104986 [Homalodisca vitripennis]